LREEAACCSLTAARNAQLDTKPNPKRWQTWKDILPLLGILGLDPVGGVFLFTPPGEEGNWNTKIM